MSGLDGPVDARGGGGGWRSRRRRPAALITLTLTVCSSEPHRSELLHSHTESCAAQRLDVRVLHDCGINHDDDDDGCVR